MKTLELNETPVRTSKNFQINYLKYEDFEFPKIADFENVTIEKKNSDIDDVCTNVNLTYGILQEFENHINEQANSKIHIQARNRDIRKIPRGC